MSLLGKLDAWRAPVVSGIAPLTLGADMIILDFVRTRSLSLAAIAFACLFAVGCAKPYHIIHQAQPNPFIGKTQFVIAPVDFTGLRVGSKTEDEYIADKKDESVESWNGDKQAINDKFQESLSGRSAEKGLDVTPANGVVHTYLIKPQVRFIEPGFYAYVAKAPSKVEMVVVITDEHNNEIDKIMVEHGTDSGMFNPSSGQRLRSDAEALGSYVSIYLKDRTTPDK
jgi:hypothetical protein